MAKGANPSAVRILAVTVLYKVAPGDCICLQTLEAAEKTSPPGLLSMRSLVYDNTPGLEALTSDSGTIRYEARSRTHGLAIAYNRALEIAHDEGIHWLLLLDQDTILPKDFFASVCEQIKQHGPNARVVALVPIVRSGGVIVSPKRIGVLGLRTLPESGLGVQYEEITAINSGTVIRCDFVRSIGGFNAAYWLDYLDYWLFRQIYAAGKQVAVSNCTLEHSLSVLDYRQNMTMNRYRSILAGESAFITTHRSKAQVLIYLLRLLVRSVKMVIRRQPDMAALTISTALRIMRHPTRSLEANAR
jgi:GT2 family glycosyltransferase